MSSAETGDLSPREFVDRHRPALERDEVRHNVLLSVLGRVTADEGAAAHWWSFDEPGACAAQSAPFPIVLGDLSQPQCRALADATRPLDYPAVVGPDRTALWFAERATELGVAFAAPIPEQIHALRAAPRYPGSPGEARLVGPDDAGLLFDWMVSFINEAVPHQRPPSREQVAEFAAAERFMLWIVEGEPVSMAGIARRLTHTAAIAPVYTPAHLRQRGYAGSVTAAVVERIFAEGKTTACLYTDQRNPFSNRCYAKIGFKPVCESWHYARTASPSA
jgi:predicted GNAT family acetyltransferase